LKTKEQSGVVNIGRITSAVGIRGELRVLPCAYDSNNLKEGKVLLLGHVEKETDISIEENEFINLTVEKIRFHKDRPVIKLDGIDDRNTAEGLKGMEIFIKAEELEDLPEGEYYVRDIIGFEVIDLSSGKSIGILQDVIQNTSQSILDIKTEKNKQVLIPAVEAFMKKIDVDNKVIEVELIPGFI